MTAPTERDIDMVDTALCIIAQHGVHITDKDRHEFYNGVRNTMAYKECREAIETHYKAKFEKLIESAKPEPFKPQKYLPDIMEGFNRGIKDYEANLREKL